MHTYEGIIHTHTTKAYIKNMHKKQTYIYTYISTYIHAYKIHNQTWLDINKIHANINTYIYIYTQAQAEIKQIGKYHTCDALRNHFKLSNIAPTVRLLDVDM